LISAVNSATAYPTLLQGLLAARYVKQSPSVINEGNAGESVLNATRDGVNQATLTRLINKLSEHQPEVLLLQEGINDLNINNPAVIPEIREALRRLVQTARNRGVIVLVGTLLPERPCSCRAFAPFLVSAANDEIKAMAASEGAPIVDLHQAFAGREAELLGVDGLHPNAAGYQKMADTFFAAVRSQFETSSSTSLTR
jgi:lysophospholipase L1-like esterase